MRDLIRMLRTLAWVAFIAALYQELRKPPEERTWHGRVAGIIPYDFRFPTMERIRSSYWDPTSDRVFSDKVIGVGWAINIPVALRKLDQALRQYNAASMQIRARISARVPQPIGRRAGNGNTGPESR